MRNFKELKIWQKGMEIAELVYGLVEKLPNSERFGLKSQLSRAAVSIPSNIAEGGSRSSQKEFKYFLQMALGSCFEIETQILLLPRVNMLEGEEVDRVLICVTEQQKMISGLLGKLRT